MRLKLAVPASIAAVGFLVSLVAHTGLVGTAGSRPMGVSGVSVSEEALSHAIDIRQTLGLRSDESYVRSTFDLPIRPSMYVDIPITGAEEHFIGQQDAVGS